MSITINLCERNDDEQGRSAGEGIKNLNENLPLFEKTFNRSVEYLKRFCYYAVVRRNLCSSLRICFEYIGRKIKELEKRQDSESKSLTCKLNKFYRESLTKTRLYLRDEIDARSSATDIDIVKMFYMTLVSML